MSPKIALILLICSCVVLGMASADRRQQRPNQARSTQQRRGHPIRRTLPPADEDLAYPEGPQATDDGAPIHVECEVVDADWDVDETPSTLKPLAANRKDNKHPKH
ncbi:uncharacterized protein [Drosophila kikkawai]|uniref:Secreted protein n=1 Tax=Drosophila kikkawai TaxID=30033 RepID=A0ABM4GI11_DROKI